jgi:hypothetical protein
MLKTLTLAVALAALSPTDAGYLQGRKLASENRQESTPAEARPRTHAEAKITVQNSRAVPYDQSPGPPLMELHLTESFTGDIEGESAVRAFEVARADRSASLASMQRFRGEVHGRRGAFVLQGSETVDGGRIKATWFVVPGSGTGALTGLRGEGGFAGSFGKGSEATLDYWFE